MHAPLLGIFPVPEAEGAERLIEQVVLAERHGLDLVGIQDHPYQRRFLDTWTLLSYLAGRTERIRLFPDVANLPLRPPALLAKAAASLDRLSGGRVELGLGAGAFWEGVGAWGGPVRSAGESVDALEEAIGIIRRVWGGERGIRFEGRHYRLAGAHGGPPPAHDIGIWLGAYGPRMMRVVGRLADGWIPSLPRLPLDEVPRRTALLEEAAERAGRDPARIVRLANVNGAIVDGPVTEWLHGPVEHWVEEIAALVRDLRFDGVVLWCDHDDVLAQTERFAREVAPGVRAALGGTSTA
jgi:alkanesulfonate monooxygenase SsuD/methylene tetrahydromethanopterin reductase-like flavin-dependent oxidoreductase (luciferase family)